MTMRPITLPIVDRDILRQGTRKTVDSWLRRKPMTYDGFAYCAIHQRFFCMPPEGQDQAKLASYRFEKLTIRPTYLLPVYLHPETTGYRTTYDLEMTDECMRPFRDAFYELSFDETALRLYVSGLEILCARGGSSLDLFHMPGGTLVLSDAYDPSKPQSDDEHRWQSAAAGHLFLRPARTHHEKLQQIIDLERINAALPYLTTRPATSAPYLDLQPFELPGPAIA